MKTRNGFVSNSSSSSYIVIANSGDASPCEVKQEKWESLQVPNDSYGCTEFGWQFQTYNDFMSKLNWCAILLLQLYAKDRTIEMHKARNAPMQPCPEDFRFTGKFEECYRRLRDVCKEKFNLNVYLDLKKISIFEDFTTADCCPEAYVRDCYIDHQSNIFENPDNARMLLSDDDLFNFLNYEGSCIENGNDNGLHGLD